jgi:hypothetical protein
MRLIWVLPLVLALQEEPFRKLVDWENRCAPAQHAAIQDVGKRIFTEEGLKRFVAPMPRELVKVSVQDDLLRAEDKSGTREFRIEWVDGKLMSVELDDLPWPRVSTAAAAEVPEEDVDRSEAKKAVQSYLKLRGEVNRRLKDPLAELAKLLPRPSLPETRILSQDLDRKFALVYLVHALRMSGDEPELWAVRIKLRKQADGWRIDEEGIYCPACPEHAKCKSCFGRGIMAVGDSDKAVCIGCRPDGDCKVCQGTGYRTRFSLLKN